ncbi:MAG: alpha/beta hydrolase, partial [Chloroflexi bacterium]|nr:alpha/beta hydrolase [Chloroflexota bacterium]
MPSARLNGVTLAYETRGDGLPLLFIHGGYGGPSSTHWPGPRLEWLMPAGDFTTILYDRRCAGDSEYVDRPFTLDDLARDAVALLDHLQ